MANFSEELKKMHELMAYMAPSECNEHAKTSNIEFQAKGPDNKVYGIIRENAKYYIKVADADKEAIVENFDYIGGFRNKKEHEYKSYTNALKQLELKLRGMNENFYHKVDTEFLDASKKADVPVNLTEDMRLEIARQRNIMKAADMIAKEGHSIDQKNVGVLEAPKTEKDHVAAGEPFEDKGEAKLDKDLNAKVESPEKAGNPFEKDGEATDKDMQSDKKEKSVDSVDDKPAEYVPDNSVADKKPAGAKAIKMNEDNDAWHAGLPSEGEEAHIGHDDISKIGVAEGGEILGDPMADTPEPELGLEASAEDDVMSDEDFEALLDKELDKVEAHADDIEIVDDEEEEIPSVNQFESKMKSMVEAIVENAMKKIMVKEDADVAPEKKTRIRGNGVGILKSDFFKNSSLMPFMGKYQKLIDSLREMKAVDDPDMVDELFEKCEKDYLLMKKVITTIQKGGKLNMRPEEYDKLSNAINEAGPDMVKTLLLSLEDVWSGISSVWDEKYAKPEDEKFNAENDKWNSHKVDDLGFAKDTDIDDISALERRDKEYYSANESTQKEFGKHPGYRKKVMTTPPAEKDEPFGKEVGDGKPFDKEVKMITDAVMAQLKEMYKKKE